MTSSTWRIERDRGFTLIELLVVIIIIGVLAAIAIPVFLNQRKKAVDAGLKQGLRSMALVQETSVIDTGARWNYDSRTPTSYLPDGSRFKTSNPNTEIYAYGGSTLGYCIKAYNPGASMDTTYRITYDSLLGGYQGWAAPLGGAC